MEELLHALTLLFDALLLPFSDAKEPQKRWMKVSGLLVAAGSVVTAIGIVAYMYL